MKQPKTLSKKIVLSFTLISIIVLVIIFGTLERINKEAFYGVELEKANIIADTVEPLLALDIYLELDEKKQQLAGQLIENPNILSLRIVEEGKETVRLESPDYDAEAQNFFLITKKLTMPNTDIPVGELEIIYSSKRYNELITQYTELVLYLLVGMTVVFLFLALYVRHLLSPLRKIARLLSLTRPDKEMVFPYREEDNEIGIIATALTQMHAKVYANFMLQKEKNIHLEEQVDEQQRLIYESNQRFKEVFNNEVFGIWIIDKERNTLDVNGKLLDMLKYEKEDLLNKNILRFIAPEDSAFVETMTVLTENKPDKQQYEVLLTDKGGETLPTYFHASAIRNRDGKVIGAFAFIDDLREKRLMQAELERKTRRLELLNTKLGEEVAKEVEKRRKSEQMMYQQSRLAAMGQLIVAISHNWRNPLNSLGLLIQDLEDAYVYGELDHDYLKQMSKKSLSQINFMSQTIDDFANFFKPVGEQETFHIRRLVYNTVIYYEPDLAKESITIKEAPECTDFEMTGYPGELQKVLHNLIGNAKDAIEEKMEKEKEFQGEITLAYNTSATGNYVLVSDNGGGIPDEIIDKVFDPYYTTKEQGKGTGLGLYMSKVIIENTLNGRLSVHNDEKGAVFKIELP